MSDCEPHELDEYYPVWRRTDWTPYQRGVAIRGLLLLAVSCGLLATCLAWWRTASLAATLIAPFGVTLLCLGVAHLNKVYWYARQYDAGRIGERQLRQIYVITYTIWLETPIDLGTLVVQLVGATVVLESGLAGWGVQDSFTVAWLMAVPVIIGLLANINMWALTSTFLSWRPRRDPAANALGPPARGIRLLLRWLVMVVAASGPFLAFLVIAPPWVLAGKYEELSYGDPELGIPTPKLAALFGLAAGLFLIFALSELTNRERAPDQGA